jgi:hypothetical protein
VTCDFGGEIVPLKYYETLNGAVGCIRSDGASLLANSLEQLDAELQAFNRSV